MMQLFNKMNFYLLKFNIKMDQFIKVNLKIEKNMEKAYIHGKMVTYTKVILMTELLKEMVLSNTLVAICITDR